MDRDSSGSITRQELDCEEFRAIMRAAIVPGTGGSMGGVAYARAEMAMDRACQYCLRKADINRDNSLSFGEFKSFLFLLRQDREAKHTADLIFALFDVDQDNMIDESEFREIYRFYLGHNPTEEQFQEEWGRLDASSKFRVTRAEYTRWLQTSPNPVFRQHGPPLEAEDELGGGSFSGGPSMASGSGTQWRPWHKYTHLSWARVGGAPPDAALGASASSHGQSSGFGSPSSGSDMTNRSGLKKSASSSSILMRPKWNQRLAVANANWADKNGRPRRPMQNREFFSRPHSLPELERYYATNKGFRDHSAKLAQKDLPRKKSVLSTDLHDPSPEELRAGCSQPAGYQRDPATKLRKSWEEHYHKERGVGSFYVSGTMDLRVPGPPPKHLYMDLYDQEF